MSISPEDCYFLYDSFITELIHYNRPVATYENYQIREAYLGTKFIVGPHLPEKVAQAAFTGTEDNLPQESRRLVCYVPTFALAENENGSLEPCPIVLRRKKETFSTWGPIEKSRPSRIAPLQKNFSLSHAVAQATVALVEELDIPTASPPNEEFSLELSPLGIIHDTHANTRVPKYVPPLAVVVFCQIKNGAPVNSTEKLLNPNYTFAHHLLPNAIKPEQSIPPRPQESGSLSDALFVMAYNGLRHIYGDSLDDWSRLVALALMERYSSAISPEVTTVIRAGQFKAIKRSLNETNG